MNTPDRHELEEGALRPNQEATPLPTPDPAPTRRRKWRRGLGLLVVLLLISSYLPFDTLWVLATGWFRYGLRVGSQLGQHWQGLASGLVLVVLSFYSLHAVLRRQHQPCPENASSDLPTADSASGTAPHGWHWKTTGIMLMLLMMTTAFTLCAGAVLHQVGWLLRQDRWGEARWNQRALDSRQVNNLRQLALSVRVDWQDRGGGSSGVFPTREQLHALRSDDDIGPYFSTVSWKAGSTPELWIPIEGIPVEGAEDLPLIVSPFYDNDRILVATADALVTIMTMDEWHDALEQWRPRFVEHDIPWPRAFDVLGR